MKKIIALLAAATMVAGFASAQGKANELLGSGATFPQPLYVAIFDQYLKANKVKVNFNGNGSGAGIKDLSTKTTDFGASDAPMNEGEIKAAGAEVVHVPATIGAIVVTYNVPGVKTGLKLTGSVIAGIFLGTIDKWNDAEIVKLNPGVKLPDLQIIVVRRSDSSGTSFNFTGYLTKVSPEWAKNVGQNKSPKWPVGVGGKGNPGVASYVKQVPGSLGYVEIAYAIQNKMDVALIQNKSGNFIDPRDLKAVSLAGDVEFPADGKADIIDTPAKGGYPIAATTWLLVYKDQSYTKDAAKSKAVVDLFWYVLHDGQKLSEKNLYAQLPPSAIKVAEHLIKSVTFDGKALKD